MDHRDDRDHGSSAKSTHAANGSNGPKDQFPRLEYQLATKAVLPSGRHDTSSLKLRLGNTFGMIKNIVLVKEENMYTMIWPHCGTMEP